MVRYISLEGLVESDKKTYYESLYESSQGWHEANHPLNPWMNFSLGKLNLAYKRFERQVAVAEEVYADFARSSEAAKVEHVLEIVAVGQLFDRAFIESQSGASGRTTRRVIEKWLAAGRLRAEGEGRARHYRKLPVLLA